MVKRTYPKNSGPKQIARVFGQMEGLQFVYALIGLPLSYYFTSRLIDRVSRLATTIIFALTIRQLNGTAKGNVNEAQREKEVCRKSSIVVMAPFFYEGNRRLD